MIAHARAGVQVYDEKTGVIKEVTMVGELREDAFSWKGHVLQKIFYKDTKRLTNGCVMQPLQVKGGDSGKVHFHVCHHFVRITLCKSLCANNFACFSL